MNGDGDGYLLYDADGDGSFNNNDVLIVISEPPWPLTLRRLT